MFKKTNEMIEMLKQRLVICLMKLCLLLKYLCTTVSFILTVSSFALITYRILFQLLFLKTYESTTYHLEKPVSVNYYYPPPNSYNRKIIGW